MGRNDSGRNPPDPSVVTTDSTYSEDGVDVTLIPWMLSLTAAERLEALESTMRSLLRLRGDVTET